MLRKLQVLAAASRLRTFTVAELASASNVSESTVHTVLQRCPDNWFSRLRTTNGAPGGQPHQLELTEVGAAGIAERLGRLPNAEPLIAPTTRAEDLSMPMGIWAARASLGKFAGATSAASEEESRQAALHSLAWAEAELSDGDFASNAEALRGEIRELRRQLTEMPSIQQSKAGSKPYIQWLTQIAGGLRTLASRFESYSHHWTRQGSGLEGFPPPVLISYFGADAKAREMASFTTGMLATEVQRLGHHWTEPSDAHELLQLVASEAVPGEFSEPLRLLLCISTPGASQELRVILKHTRLLIDRQRFAPESWVLDCGHSREVERVTKQLALNYEPNARQPSSLTRWVNLIFANAARSPLSPGVLPYNGSSEAGSKHSVATYRKPAQLSSDLPATRVIIRTVTLSTFEKWTGKHSKGSKVEGTIRKVDAAGATIDLGSGVKGYLKASELSPEPAADARALLKVDQKVPALYADSSRKKRTITVLVDAARTEGKKIPAPRVPESRPSPARSTPAKKAQSGSDA